MLPKGCVFDANGKEGFKDSILRFHDQEGADVTDEYLTVSPDGAFNPAYFIGLKKTHPKTSILVFVEYLELYSWLFILHRVRETG